MENEILKSLNRYTGMFKEGREILKNYEQFLSSGRYIYAHNGKSIYYNTKCKKALKFIEDSRAIPKEVILEGETFKCKLLTCLKKSIKKYIFTVSIYPKRISEFDGSLGLITAEEEVKIFNFKEKKVLSHIANKEKYNLIKEAHANFNHYFHTLILQFNDENQEYIESYLEYIPSQQWNMKEQEKITIEIFERYACYFKSCKKKQVEMVKVEDIVKGWEKNPIIKELIDKKVISLKNILNLEFPKLSLHGDLYSNNILFEGKQIYLIDFEHYGNYIFFHDLICWILIDFTLKRNDTYLINYMKGKYDFIFEEVFRIFGLIYNANMKKEYLTIVVLEQIMKRDDCSIEDYLQLFNRFEEMKREI